MTSSSTSSNMAVKSLANFRLLEGTCLYRSSNPQGMNVDDVPLFVSLGIKTILDLRSQNELLHPKSKDRHTIQLLEEHFSKPLRVSFEDGHIHYNPAFTESRVKTDQGKHINMDIIGLKLPWKIARQAEMLDQIGLLYCNIWDAIWKTNYLPYKLMQIMGKTYKDSGLFGHYQDMIDICQDKIRDALLVLCEPALHPLCVCCAVGKDRTGVVVALALSVLGWEPHRICQDYALSQAGVAELDFQNVPKLFESAEYETMKNLLDFINDKYGSILMYLDKIGVGKEKQESLRLNLSRV